MCKKVITQDGWEIETAKGLADSLNLWVEDLVVAYGYSKVEPAGCLCQINIEKSLSGFQWERRDTDYLLHDAIN